MKKNSIFKQAAFLAGAGIVVRIIGLLYRSPLTKLITAQGMGYYTTAYTVYALILLISSYSIPTAISKLLSEKLAAKQYNNAKKILICAFIYIIAIGGSVAVITYLIAPFIVPENATPVLRVLCPTIFLSGLLGVFRGYFQALKTTVYTGISQIIEQLFNAVVSIGAAYIFIQPYLDVSQTKVAVNGAAGSALGTGAGVLISLIYMIFMFCRTNRFYTSVSKDKEADDYTDSYKAIFKMIINIVTPIILATCVYNLVSTIDMYMFLIINGDNPASINAWAAYGGEYLILQNVPVALASAMSTASIPTISTSWVVKDFQQVKQQICSSTRIIMLILVPCAAGMMALAYPIINCIFPQQETVVMATTLLTFGAPAIIFYGLSTYTNGILQALGHPSIPLKNALSALIIHCVITLLLLLTTNLGIYAFVLGNCLYGLQLCFSNQKAIRKITTYSQEKVHTFIYPLIASLIMVAIVFISYHIIISTLNSQVISLAITIIIGAISYFIVILYLYKEHLDELADFPYINKLIKKN